MKNIQTNKSYKVLVDSAFEDEMSFIPSDLIFLLNKQLVDKVNDKVRVKFVGEVITPNANYISLPKNFIISENNVSLIQKVLNEYKNLKKDGNILMTNLSFSPNREGVESPIFYFNKLKGYFLDYITYEFIYPKKKLLKHSSSPIRGGKLDVVKTEFNVGRKPGITYKVKDIKNNERWCLDDIYYTTLINLCDENGSEKDKQKISNMSDFLLSEGYEFKEIDINIDTIINDIKSCEAEIKHNPIKNTLIGYYESKRVGESHSIRAFYTRNFEYVWEYFSQIVLENKSEFKEEVVLENPITLNNADVATEGQLRPDIFSQYNNHRFIGDSKYYSKIDSDFYKEMYEYNTAVGNKYPMVVFVPSIKTTRSSTKRQGIFELVIIKVSLEDVISDIISDTREVIQKTHYILERSSRRWNKSKF